MSKLPLFEARATITGSIDTNIVSVFQDSGKKAIPPKGNYASLVDKLRKAEVFAAKLSSIQFVRFSGKDAGESVLFLGLGNPAELTEEKLRGAGGNTWAKLIAEKSRVAVVHVDSFFEIKSGKPDISHTKWIRAFSEGLILGAYQFEKYKSKPKEQGGDRNEYKGPEKILFVSHEKTFVTDLEAELAQVSAIGEAVSIARDWSNEPSNYGNPVYFAQEARKFSRQYGLKCRILSEQDAAREKMGLFLGVSQGSKAEARFIVLEYIPKKVKNPKTVALVGKGVTFDSGGISIKPSARMEDMKHDMTGAATVMGAIVLASLWKVPNRVIAIMPFTENMPSGEAIQPGNILVSRNGKTVEVINTDAEGRLILADALDYAQDLKPDAIVDVATLTGAVSIALGKQCCGIMGNDEALIDALQRAGESTGERIWELPLYDEYFDDLKSDIADMKNSANDSNGGTIRGAIFLKQFVKKGTRWAHLDIAAMAYNLGHLSYFPKKGASGAFVRTLAQFVADF